MRAHPGATQVPMVVATAAVVKQRCAALAMADGCAEASQTETALGRKMEARQERTQAVYPGLESLGSWLHSHHRC